MALVCPHCNAPDLKIRDSVELGPDAHWDERTVQRAHCPQCNHHFVCNYQEQRSFHSDRDDYVSHVAYDTSQWFWHAIGTPFSRPQRRRSPPWRRRLASWVLKICRRSEEPLPLRYEASKRHS